MGTSLEPTVKLNPRSNNETPNFTNSTKSSVDSTNVEAANLKPRRGHYGHVSGLYPICAIYT